MIYKILMVVRARNKEYDKSPLMYLKETLQTIRHISLLRKIHHTFFIKVSTGCIN